MPETIDMYMEDVANEDDEDNFYYSFYLEIKKVLDKLESVDYSKELRKYVHYGRNEALKSISKTVLELYDFLGKLKIHDYMMYNGGHGFSCPSIGYHEMFHDHFEINEESDYEVIVGGNTSFVAIWLNENTPYILSTYDKFITLTASLNDIIWEQIQD